ncbi:maleylacetate reductase [Georgenia thermotolerans]|uniref:Iron-containing alcohol dehydrogenase n=1 Tax=Georgenia thermotolerans TaxID=527326 RepID=A0A7J5UTL0_9MICO|nr:maleylacetate reductase [Georgenia thermotolerans]KAE8765616.1 iron-containing alcohol dehydrogenase [Georgenia thermotolerans]
MSSIDFTHVSYAQRVVFGTGQAARHLCAEVGRIGAQRVMVITGSTGGAAAERLTSGLDVVHWWRGVQPHVPAEQAETARRAAAASGADVLVSVGGGSAVGLAKAVALTTGLPVVAVPTTYAGSEATPVWGITETARKTTGTDPRVLPAAVIYDAELTLGLPVELTVASGLNSLAHCVDSLWAPRANPLNALHATEGMRALARGLRAVAADPLGLPGREQCLYGTYLAAAAFAAAGSGLHHKICHVLGGRYDLPHAQTHAVVLPHVLAHQMSAFPSAGEAVAQALNGGESERGAVDGLTALVRLRAELGGPVALRDHGLRFTDLAEATELVMDAVTALGAPRPGRDDVRRILEGAWSGVIPA